jgi:RHS repeat-associated protein
LNFARERPKKQPEENLNKMKKLLTFAIALFAVACFQTTVLAEEPVANDDFYTVHGTQTLDTGANDVGSAIPETVTQPTHGNLSTLASPTRHFYIPQYGYTGPDSFTYRYCYNTQSGTVCTAVATVTIDVVNQAPVTTNSVYTIHLSGVLGPFVTGAGGDYDPDGDELAVQNIVILVPPTRGSLVSTVVGDIRNYIANIVLEPAPDFFDYQICDSLGACSVGRVSINIVDDTPVAVHDFFLLTGISRHLNVEANDYSLDNDPFDISPNDVTGSTQHGDNTGRAVVEGEDGFNYVRWWQVEPNFFGTDGFYYKVIENGSGRLSNQARVTILLIPIGDAEDAGTSCTVPPQPYVPPKPSVNPSKGEPVNVTNGNMWLQEEDFSLPGPGENISVERTYNSILPSSGLFGYGWSTKYDESLQFFADDKMLRLNMPDGKAIYFGRATSSDTFHSVSPDVFGEIVQNIDSTYILTFRDGRSHKFDSGGTLLWQKDRNGSQTTLTYSGGFLTKITDAFGHELYLSPDTNGKIEKLTYDGERIATYTYLPGTDHLESVDYEDGSKYQFTYDTINDRPYLITVKDALENVLESHTYDTQGRALTSERQGGVEKYTFEYTTPTLTTVEDAVGNFSKYHFDKSKGKNVIVMTEGVCDCGNGSEITTYAYDSHLNLVKKTDALSNVTSYKYDRHNNMIEVTDALSVGDHKLKYTYNSFGRVLTATDRMDGVTTNTYDSLGNLETSTDPLNHTTTLTYTPLGQLETVKDALNHITTVSYNSEGRPEQVSDALTNLTKFDFDVRGRISKVTNALDEDTSYEYDTRNRLKKVTYPDTYFVSFEYDTGGRRISMTNERQYVTTYSYDTASRLETVTDPIGHGTTFGYDLMSNMTSQTDAVGNITNYKYNEFNRLEKVTHPLVTPEDSEEDRLKESFGYDKMGNVITKIDTAGRQTVFHYDNAYRMDYTVDAEGKTTYFAHNARSQTTKVTDALGQEYVFTYDPMGRTLSETRKGTTKSYLYNAVGNRTKRTDHGGAVTDYAYDVLNRLTGVTYASSTNFANYGYDELSRLTSAENQVGTVSFTYDNRSRVESTTDVFEHLLQYGYDESGNRTSLSQDTVRVSSYGYDKAGRMTTQTDETNGIYHFDYDDANRFLTKTLPNGVVTFYTYDGMSRLTRLEHRKDSTTIFDNQYLYNPANNIDQIISPTQTRSFSYDDVDRLTGVTVSSSEVENYEYDAIGNRTASHLNSFINYTPNRIFADDYDYTFDPNGNLVDRSTHGDTGGIVTTTDPTTYRWDDENHLVEMTITANRGGTMEYQYDALGRRVKRTLDHTVETDYTYDGQDVVYEAGNEDPVVYQNGFGIDNKLKRNNGRELYFQEDHLGSTVALTSNLGVANNSTDYDSFGNKTEATFPNGYEFTGREYENFTGLMYYRARWYDPKLGRFISEDPIGFAGGDVNLYGYVRNNPVNSIDPLGTEVFAVYYRSDRRLDVMDVNPGKGWFDKVINIGFSSYSNLFSGHGACKNKNGCDAEKGMGPTPLGYYLIGTENYPDWLGGQPGFPLYRSQNETTPSEGPFMLEDAPVTDPITGNRNLRGGYYFHAGSISYGCLTFPADQKPGEPGYPSSRNFTALDGVLKNTSPLLYKGKKFSGSLIVVR